MSDLASRLLGRAGDQPAVRPRLPSRYEPAHRGLGSGPASEAAGNPGDAPRATAAPLSRQGTVTSPTSAALPPPRPIVQAGDTTPAASVGAASPPSSAWPRAAPAPDPDRPAQPGVFPPGPPAETTLMVPRVPVASTGPRPGGSAGPGPAPPARPVPVPLSAPAPLGPAAQRQPGHPVQAWPAHHAAPDAAASPVPEPSAVLAPPLLAHRQADGPRTRPPGQDDAGQQVVHVTIGRIEVRADRPPAQERRPPRNKPLLSLDDYLRRRSHGGPR
jgi:hypothetical protein